MCTKVTSWGEVRTMSAIRRYIDGLFEKVPEDADSEQLKEEIIADLEARYDEYLFDGYSENEALGMVMNEAGDIEEIISEIKKDKGTQKTGLVDEDEKERQQIVLDAYKPEEDEVFSYLDMARKSGRGIGFGVFLILFGTALFMALSALLGENHPIGQILGIASVVVTVAAAVGIFIYSGMKYSAYSKFDAYFLIDRTLKKEIKNEKEAYRGTYTVSIIIGIGLIIISALPVVAAGLLFPNSDSIVLWAVSLLLVMVGIGACLLTYAGNVWGSYNTILKNGRLVSEITSVKKFKRSSKIYRLMENIYWPMVILIFFIWSIVFGWGFSWLIFIAAGIFEDVILGLFDLDDEDD